MSAHYSPGAHPVAVTPHGFAVLADDTSPALAARIHALVADGRGLGGVLEALTGAYGTSLAAVPPFAVALAEAGSVRLAVRGDFALDVESATAERVSGEGVTTWTERVIVEASRVSLVSEADAPPPELPVTDGVVLAAGLVWVPGTGASPVAPPRPAEAAVGPAASSAPRRKPASTDPAPGESAPIEPEPDAEPEPVSEPVAAPEPEPPAVAAPEPASPASPVGAGRSALVPDAPSAAPLATTATSGLIDSAAVLSLADTLLPAEETIAPHADAAAPIAEVAPDPVLEATVVRPKDAAPPVVQGDHDGATISLAEARALRGADSPPPLAPPRPPAPGRIRVSTGQVMTLDRTIVIGRRPRSTRVSGTDLPHLVAVDSPQQDISRSHVELRVEGDSILATDLHTTNGTTLLRAGVDPMRLHPGEGTVVVPGDVIDLGDGITVAIEELT